MSTMRSPGSHGALAPLGQSTVLSGSDGGTNLADVLERVLDKGVVIAGDIQINLLDIELLTIKLRLVVASVDTARRMGINWWESDPMLAGAKPQDDPKELRQRIHRLERELEQRSRSAPGET
ncbi:MAG TPA: gas vesicle protein [Solirubrobacteraceae bacterium]|nr:gas vesicle protein [Solirubrobacteraceae bacterium]